MFSRFFIERPVFASVISIIIVLAGLAGMMNLPIAQYPEIIPPDVVVTANYPGASAEVIASTVAAPLEQQINGVRNMTYMRSTSSNAGSLNLTITFEIGTDPDQAAIDVNNRVQAALPRLPEDVRRLGVTVNKRSASILQVVTLFSPNGRYDPIFISNYALLNIMDDIKRLPGVGEATLFGAKDYSMRIWLRPDKLAQYHLTPADVAAAIREQNSQFAAGQFGQEPMVNPQSFTYTVTTQGQLADPAQFGNIILRSDSQSATLRLKDVARIELGAVDYGFAAKTNGKPAVVIGIFLQPGANALATTDLVAKKMEELSKRFPDGVSYSLPFNTTRFVKIAIEEVVKTFLEAIVLVVLVVFIFLQNARATLIPLLAVPVSLIGTFAGMYLLGFSINLLTLFGMVLAIGIVVDDAIVVLENVERLMSTEKLSPKEAAIKAMEEVTGPIIAIVLVLCAVFVPVGFMGGLTGEMYRQFAVTIAISVVISGFVALTLSPALCAVLLKPHENKTGKFFSWFNRTFVKVTEKYTAGASFLVHHVGVGAICFLLLIGATALVFMRIPPSLVPEEDQGYIFSAQFLLPGASLTRTEKVVDTLADYMAKQPEVEGMVTFAGFDLLSGSLRPNTGAAFFTFKPWDERSGEAHTSKAMVGRAFGANGLTKDGFILAFNPPPITGISLTGGFEGYLQSRSGGSIKDVADAAAKVVAEAAKHPELANVQTTVSANVPQYYVELDRAKAKALGVPVTSVFAAMQSTFGSYYVNDFTLYGRTFRVSLQSEAEFREKPEDLRQVFVRSDDGKMIPLDTLLSFKRVIGPDLVDRFNVFPSAKLMGGPAPGYSSGQAIKAMEDIVAKILPPDYSLDWTGSAYQEKRANGAGGMAFVFGIVMVFLILAAQYERWTMPLAVITAVPFAVFGAAMATWIFGQSNDVYFQVGLLTLIGLGAKNAILIVEFAILKVQEGKSFADAALEGARLRFRPIVMTSLAFVLGCVPLVISEGAGAGSRHAVGTGVIGGMIAATAIATFFVPMFFFLISKIGYRKHMPTDHHPHHHQTHDYPNE